MAAYTIRYTDGIGDGGGYASRAGTARISYPNGDSFEGGLNAKGFKVRGVREVDG